jgi:hypothetical protein
MGCRTCETSGETGHGGHPHPASSQGEVPLHPHQGRSSPGAASGGRPRAGNDTTETGEPASPSCHRKKRSHRALHLQLRSAKLPLRQVDRASTQHGTGGAGGLNTSEGFTPSRGREPGSPARALGEHFAMRSAPHTRRRRCPRRSRNCRAEPQARQSRSPAAGSRSRRTQTRLPGNDYLTCIRSDTHSVLKRSLSRFDVRVGLRAVMVDTRATRRPMGGGGNADCLPPE